MAKISLRTKQIMLDKKYGNTCVAFATSANNNKCVMLDVNKIAVFNPTQKMYDDISNEYFHWTMYIAVFSYRNKEPREELHYEVHRTTGRYKHEWCTTKFNEIHQSLLQECIEKGVKVSGAGWIASVVDHNFSEEKIFKLFHKINAWN
jgi:hypothetical protein